MKLKKKLIQKLIQSKKNKIIAIENEGG